MAYTTPAPCLSHWWLTPHLPLVCRACPVRALCSSGEGLFFVRDCTIGDIEADWLSNRSELHEKFKKQHKSAVRRAGKQRSQAAGGGRR